MPQGIKKAEFVTSAARYDQCPPEQLPEVAITGRSNAGKSTLINSMTGRKIAKVSGTAGKTTLLNFFDIDEYYRLVDMPGYGWAKRSAKEMASWKKMIEAYLEQRSVLGLVILVMDIRRDWQDEEEMLCQYLDHLGVPCLVILTKADKLSFSQKKNKLQKIKQQSGREFLMATTLKKHQDYLAVDQFIRKKLSESAPDKEANQEGSHE